jgi:hypothetical protein
MKTITFEEAFKLLEDAAAVIVNDDYVAFPNLEAGDHTFLELGSGMPVRFRDDENKNARIINGELVLINTRGYRVRLKLLKARNLSEEA